MKKLLSLVAALLLIVSFQSLNARKRYSGIKHSSSHSGTYKSGKGSSHKGGSYKIRKQGTDTENINKLYFLK